MSAPPDPEMRRPATRQSDGTKFAKPGSKKHPQRYTTPLDFQAALALLAPTILLIALLAVVGAGR
jgi:hypothetical protein